MPEPIPDAAATLARLTPRQRGVAELIARGFARHEVATLLGVAPGTVDAHVHAALRAAGLERSGQLAALVWSVEVERAGRAAG